MSLSLGRKLAIQSRSSSGSVRNGIVKIAQAGVDRGHAVPYRFANTEFDRWRCENGESRRKAKYSVCRTSYFHPI
jgi:hypothetical protein